MASAPTANPLRSFLDGLLGALGLREAETPGPEASAVASEQGTLTHLTLYAAREMLAEHERGVFLRSALVAEHILRDPDLYAALTQRLETLFGLPFDVEPLDESDAAKAEAAFVKAQWSTIASRPAQREMMGYAVLLGFAIGQLVWEPGDDGELVPRLIPWLPSRVSYQEWRKAWIAHTRTGPVDVVPGTGRWVLYTPKSVNRPWMWGVIRCLVEWFLRAQSGAADASKHAEIHGLPVWLARMPNGSDTTPAGKNFLRSIRDMGRNAVVPLPRGDSDATSYDLELEAAQTDAFRIYEFLLRAAGGKFRLAILGQDLTSQNNVVGTNASSETGADTLAAIVRADAATWGECCTRQIAKPLAVYRGKPLVRVELDAEPGEDLGALATAQKTAGEAAAAWDGAGLEVDIAEHARRFGVPGKAKPKPVEPEPTTNLPPAKGTSEPDEGDAKNDDREAA